MFNFSASRLFKDHLEAPQLTLSRPTAGGAAAAADGPTSTWALANAGGASRPVTLAAPGSPTRPSQMSSYEPLGYDVLQRLPPELLRHALSFLSYDTISQIRLVCKYIDEMCRELLNHGFTHLGQLIEKAKTELKKELPKRESQRRSHRLCRVNEAYAALDTRYALLSMTYRKYIDYGVCCFIPGKVLDEGFCILRRLTAVRNQSGSQMQWDLTELLRDLRDLSSMAMEYFEESTQPFLRNPFEAILVDDATTAAAAIRHMRRSYPMSPIPQQDGGVCRRKAVARLFTSRYAPHANPVDAQQKEWKKSIEEKLEETQGLVKKQGVMIQSQKVLITRLVHMCNTMSAQLGLEPLSLDETTAGDEVDDDRTPTPLGFLPQLARLYPMSNDETVEETPSPPSTSEDPKKKEKQSKIPESTRCLRKRAAKDPAKPPGPSKRSRKHH